VRRGRRSRSAASRPRASGASSRAAGALEIDLSGVDLAVDGLGGNPFDAAADALVADAALEAPLAA
jgi:hypothetical protein